MEGGAMARMNLKEAADKLKVSIRTLRRRIKEGAIHAALEEGVYYIDITEIDRLSKEDILKKPGKPSLSTPTETITLTRNEYDSLIYKLATLEAKIKFLEAPAPEPPKRSLWKRLFSKS